MPKKLLFLTGTRADFGKIKSLINKADGLKEIDIHIFVTGMHMLSRYGATHLEVEKNKVGRLHKFINQNSQDDMDQVLAKTITGFSDYVRELKPDMIVIHGDRVEALAGAIVGALNNILVAHIEGGELSGTIDDAIRHSITKLSHLHFVANSEAQSRLVQMGESPKTIFQIGSPDIDAMVSENLPDIASVLERYDIPFEAYGIVLFHPVTTEVDDVRRQADELVDALIKSPYNYVVVYPNNDKGSERIFSAYDSLKDSSKFKMIPSVRFEYFLTLLKKAQFIIGNSSAGIREAPFYGVPSINIGSRQSNRSRNDCILQVPTIDSDAIVAALRKVECHKAEPKQEFGSGNSAELFVDLLKSGMLWTTLIQKSFYSRSL